ncbi:hypothetical protein VTK56DRAFT_4196 [Thermocarpiscus australiensis]
MSALAYRSLRRVVQDNHDMLSSHHCISGCLSQGCAVRGSASSRQASGKQSLAEVRPLASQITMPAHGRVGVQIWVYLSVMKLTGSGGDQFISGVFNNCLCEGGLSGYLDFENVQFYRDKAHFDVEKWWKAAAIVGALPMAGSFLAAVLLLMRLKPLWQASEHQSPPATQP